MEQLGMSEFCKAVSEGTGLTTLADIIDNVDEKTDWKGLLEKGMNTRQLNKLRLAVYSQQKKMQESPDQMFRFWFWNWKVHLQQVENDLFDPNVSQQQPTEESWRQEPMRVKLDKRDLNEAARAPLNAQMISQQQLTEQSRCLEPMRVKFDQRDPDEAARVPSRRSSSGDSTQVPQTSTPPTELDGKQLQDNGSSYNGSSCTPEPNDAADATGAQNSADDMQPMIIGGPQGTAAPQPMSPMRRTGKKKKKNSLITIASKALQRRKQPCPVCGGGAWQPQPTMKGGLPVHNSFCGNCGEPLSAPSSTTFGDLAANRLRYSLGLLGNVALM